MLSYQERNSFDIEFGLMTLLTVIEAESFNTAATELHHWIVDSVQSRLHLKEPGYESVDYIDREGCCLLGV